METTLFENKSNVLYKSEITNVKYISVEELKNLLMETSKATFVQIGMMTDYRMNKKGNLFYDRVKKLSINNYYLNLNYEQRVNNRYKAEGIQKEFETQKMFGRTHLKNSIYVKDTDSNVYYTLLEYFKSGKEYLFLDDNYLDDQATIDVIKSFKVKSSSSSKQEQDNKVMVITPLLSNIVFIKMNKIKYIIK